MEPMTPAMVNALTSFLIAASLFGALLVASAIYGFVREWLRERKKKKVEKL